MVLENWINYRYIKINLIIPSRIQHHWLANMQNAHLTDKKYYSHNINLFIYSFYAWMNI